MTMTNVPMPTLPPTDESTGNKAALTPADELRIARERVSKACLAELQQVLTRHGCQLHAVPFFVPDNGTYRLATRIEIIIQDR